MSAPVHLPPGLVLALLVLVVCCLRPVSRCWRCGDVLRGSEGLCRCSDGGVA